MKENELLVMVDCDHGVCSNHNLPCIHVESVISKCGYQSHGKPDLRLPVA